MIFWLNLEKAVFKLAQNLTPKLQFNGLLFSSCLWWYSHHYLCLVLWTFYLFRLMFLVYLKGFTYLSFIHVWYYGDCSPVNPVELSMALFGLQWRRMTPSYLLCCLVNVQCNVSIFFSLIRQCICHCISNPTGTLQDDY